MKNRLGRWTVVAVLLLTGAACKRMSSYRLQAVEAAPARRLVGVWNVTFTLDPAFRVRGGMDRPLRGTLALIQDHYGGVSYPQLSTPLHYGVYDIDFRRFGFDPRDRGAVPIAVASVSTDSSDGRATPVDRVHVVLDPGEAQMAITLDGTLAADSAAGTWAVDSRTASGGGTFVMVRTRR